MIHKIAAIVSDKTVANAAPATPVFNATTNSRSSTMLSRLQNTRKISGVLESPSALKIENDVKYAATAIRPPMKIYIYVSASGIRDSGVFNNNKTGFVVTSAMTVMIKAINIQV